MTAPKTVVLPLDDAPRLYNLYIYILRILRKKVNTSKETYYDIIELYRVGFEPTMSEESEL